MSYKGGESPSQDAHGHEAPLQSHTSSRSGSAGPPLFASHPSLHPPQSEIKAIQKVHQKMGRGSAHPAIDVFEQYTGAEYTAMC